VRRFLRACRDARSLGIPLWCCGIGGKASGRCFFVNAQFRHYPEAGPVPLRQLTPKSRRMLLDSYTASRRTVLGCILIDVLDDGDYRP
jgi:hypothetical protein